MIYNDEILENKAFNFFKQLMYNIALAICVMLVGVLVLVWGFDFKLYEVLSDSQYPEFKTGDMVVVKPQDKYVVGDIVKFDTKLSVTHRLIAIYDDGTNTYFICHGDNVQSVDPSVSSQTRPWKQEAAYIQSLIDEGKTLQEITHSDNSRNIQVIKPSQVEGKVVAHIDNYGTYFRFIQNHWGLIIALVAGIWCISSTVQNEIDMKRSRRLM